MKYFHGRRVLLIAPRFFGYEEEIAGEFRRRGAEVDFLPDRPFQSPFMKAVTRVRRELIIAFADRFFWNALEGFGRKKYDLILVVNGEVISPRFLSALRSTFPCASFVLYMWDSFKNRKSLIPNIMHFDKCSTFDPDDANNYGIRFRPLFYADGFKQSTKQDFEYDISFVGTAHSDRYRIVAQVAANLPSSARCYFYMYLQAPWVFWAHKFTNRAFKGASIADFMFLPLIRSEVQRVFYGSRAVLDIEHPAQTGLTIRTFETLGAEKKIITTNQRVKEYDFFNPQNILVINRNELGTIPRQFLYEPFAPLSESVNYKYSIQGWVDEVIDLNA